MQSCLIRIRDWESRAEAADYSLHALAGKCGVSVRQVERHFKKHFQLTPRRWLRGFRMEQAARLLNEKKSVKIVASDVGYNCPEHFTRAFTGHFGVAPSAYRTAGLATGQLRDRVLAACWWLLQFAEETVDALTGLAMS